MAKVPRIGQRSTAMLRVKGEITAFRISTGSGYKVKPSTGSSAMVKYGASPVTRA